jgi:non-specific serine/threonine protein kinase/serine/threonine-protein kinase
MEERLEGLLVRARLQRALGDLDGAVATTQKAITQRIALSGHDHRETAILFNSLAISLTAANRLDEALAAYRETTAIYRALGLGDGLDAQIIIANTGTLELRNGHLPEAQALLQSAVERERLLAGDSAAVAAALGYYGKVLLVTNRTAPAIEVLHQASDLAVRYAGPGSPVALQNQLFLGEAQLASGEPRTARLTLSAAHDAAVAQYGAAHLLSLRTQLALLQVDVAQGSYKESALQLPPVIAQLKALGAQGEAVRAQALETLGTALLGERRYKDAAATLQEAVDIRTRTPSDIWELARAQERLGEALAGMSENAAADILKNAARDLEAQLGGSHPETLRAAAALANARVAVNR